MADKGWVVNDDFELPYMRADVRDAVASLSDPDYQRRWWGRVQPGGSYDNLDFAVHALYDDCRVLPDPAASVPTLLTSDEVDSFRRLDDAFGPMLDELGDVADDIYLADPRWPAVVEAARAAHEMMRATDDNRTSRP